MRSADPLEPEVVAALEAIDATLYGDPVDPELAELAELSLMLRDERAEPSREWEARIDRRVAERFAASARPSPGGLRRAPRVVSRLRGSWAVAGGLAAVVVAVVVGIALAHGGSHRLMSSPSPVHAAAGASASGASASSSGSAQSSTSQSSTAPAMAPQPPAVKAATAPAPHTSAHRDVTQSADLSLRADAGRIDPVAQEVFDVIGAEHGIVMSSHVTDSAGAPGFARFRLRVPSGRLEATVRRLSSLRGARVVSREDSSADITSTVSSAATRLATAQALRHSLLRQLAAADTSTLADHIQSELARNAAAIAGDEAALTRLHSRVSDSTISVQVTAPPARHHRHHAGGHHSGGAGGTLDTGLRDAGHVLVAVAAGALVVLAVLVPLGVLAAIAAWVWALTLRRRREATLGPQH